MSNEERYYIDERIGCIAVCDSTLVDEAGLDQESYGDYWDWYYLDSKELV